MKREPRVRIDCPAKVNLFLEVLARRPDGFHEIDTVFTAVGLHDTVKVSLLPDGLKLDVEGAELPDGEGNLAWRAARLFLDRFEVRRGARIRLVKRIPVAAGLGGGSSDAAGTLRGLRELLRPEVETAALAPLAAELGSDVPFFLAGGTARGEGRGERLTPLPPPPPAWIVLFVPPFGLSTAEVYRRVRVPGEDERRTPADLLTALETGADFVPHLANRLEEAAERADPRVAEVRAYLAEALAPDERPVLSGSGSTWFAVSGSFDRAAELAGRWNAEGRGRALAARIG